MDIRSSDGNDDDTTYFFSQILFKSPNLVRLLIFLSWLTFDVAQQARGAEKKTRQLRNELVTRAWYKIDPLTSMQELLFS